MASAFMAPMNGSASGLRTHDPVLCAAAAQFGEQVTTPLRLALKVSPKASKNAINGWLGDALKVSVTSAPEKGKANKAVIELLAGALRLPKSALHIVRGETNPNKTVEISGLTQDELLCRLPPP